MRRLVVLFVVAVLAAGVYGTSSRLGGLRVNATAVSGATMRAELSAIAQSPTLQCYLGSLNATGFSPGAGGDTLNATGAAAWANAQVQGFAIAEYVATHLHHVVSREEARSTAGSLEAEMTQQAAANSLNCPGTSAQALAAMTPRMRRDELREWAASLYLERKLNSSINLTPNSLRAYYASHQANYATLCVSIAVVSPPKVAAFHAAQVRGESVVQLVKQFSLDAASAKKGGAYGCYAPTNPAYQSVRADVGGTTAMNSFPTTPHYIQIQSGTYALYVAVTKRTPTPFAQAEALVVNDVRTQNASSANAVEKTLEYEAAVYVDPSLGRWGLDTTGPRVFAPALPPTNDVLGSSALSGAAAQYH